MLDFVREQQVVGAALAVTKDRRLVYARGFGLSDRERDQPVEPNALFRIASISKPLTGAAIVQLVQRKRLTLDAKICDVLGISSTKDDRWQQVTIRQLLHHTGGWDRDKSFDPMFRSVKIAKEFKVSPPAMQETIIRYMAKQPLDFDPGTKFVYSNFGYCLLGRVIEKLARMPYDTYVRREVLQPLGIMRMKLGATLLAQAHSRRGSLLRQQRSHGPSRDGQNRRASAAPLRRLVSRSDGFARGLDCLGGRSGAFRVGVR